MYLRSAPGAGNAARAAAAAAAVRGLSWLLRPVRCFLSFPLGLVKLLPFLSFPFPFLSFPFLLGVTALSCFCLGEVPLTITALVQLLLELKVSFGAKIRDHLLIGVLESESPSRALGKI